MAYAVAFDVELDKLVPRDEPQSPWSLDCLLYTSPSPRD